MRLWCAAGLVVLAGVAWSDEPPPGPSQVELACPFEPDAHHVWLQKVERAGMSALNSATRLSLHTRPSGDGNRMFRFSQELLSIEAADETAQRVAKVLGEPKLIYEVRYAPETGAAELTNLDEVRAAMKGVSKGLRQELVGAGVPEAQAKGIVDMIASPQVAAHQGVQAVARLVRYSCGPVSVGRQRYDAKVEHPFGGDPLPASGTLVVEVQGDVVQIDTEEQVKPEGVRRLADAVMQQVAPDAPAAARKMMASLPIQLTVARSSTFDRESGILLSSTATTTTSVAGMQQKEVVETRLQR